MPELPEVETVRRGLEPALTGARIEQVELRRADLRFPFPPRFAERLTGQTILALSRRAKYILADLSSGEVLILHLGMTGRVLIEGRAGTTEPGDFYTETSRHPAHDHVVIRLSSGFTMTYNDVRRFGFMDLLPRATLAISRHFKDLGLEPLGNEFSPEALARLFARKAAPLKAVLLDQRLIAGLGNIYVCEALHRASLSPMRAAGSVARKNGQPTRKAVELAGVIREVLEEAIVAGGSTLRDYVHTDGTLGYFQHRFRVYDREGEPCAKPDCAGVVERIVQSGRSTFFCARCQS